MKAGFVTKKKTEQALAKMLTELGRGSYIEETTESVQDYFLKYLELKRPNVRPGTMKTYKWLVNYHIIPKLGQIPIAKLKSAHLVAMYERLRVEDGLSPQSVNHVHKVLHDALAIAVRHETLHRNVATGQAAKNPKSQNKRLDKRRAFTVSRLREAIPLLHDHLAGSCLRTTSGRSHRTPLDRC
ncbi:hypothetical protein SAEN111111_05455 [Saccharibacillus endophyticus]